METSLSFTSLPSPSYFQPTQQASRLHSPRSTLTCTSTDTSGAVCSCICRSRLCTGSAGRHFEAAHLGPDARGCSAARVECGASSCEHLDVSQRLPGSAKANDLPYGHRPVAACAAAHSRPSALQTILMAAAATTTHRFARPSGCSPLQAGAPGALGRRGSVPRKSGG